MCVPPARRMASRYSRLIGTTSENGYGITWLMTTPLASGPSSSASAWVPTKDTLKKVPPKPARRA